MMHVEITYYIVRKKADVSLQVNSPYVNRGFTLNQKYEGTIATFCERQKRVSIILFRDLKKTVLTGLK